MPSHIRNPLVYVWGFLTVTSMASYWISRTYDVNHLRGAAVTISVVLAETNPAIPVRVVVYGHDPNRILARQSIPYPGTRAFA